MEMNMGKFQTVFKSLRIRENLTQEEMALHLGVTRSAIGNWEQGNREPDFEMSEKIADYFNVDMNYLTGRESEENYYIDLQVKQISQEIYENQELHNLFNIVRDMDKDDLTAVTEFISKMKMK